ncbi:MAG: DUF4340 domain-containing protein [Myxococcota bacterium]|nr:DUF4340 domain-containing protein [Myxococcota bacterium]
MVKNLVALAVLAILGVIVFAVFRGGPAEDAQPASAAAPLISNSDFDTIQILRKAKGDGEKKTEKIVLKKQEDTWRLVEPVAYKIVDGTVRRMVDALSDFSIVDVISEDKARHETFQVDPDQGIDVTVRNGEQTLGRFIVGKSKNGMTFVKRPDGDPVYRVRGYHRSTFDKSAKDLRNKIIFKAEVDAIKKVTFKTGKDAVAFAFEGEGADRSLAPVDVAIKNFDEKKAMGVIRSVASVMARDFVDAPLPPESTGLDETADRAIVAFTGAGDGEEITTLVFGNDIEADKQTYVKTSASDQVFLVSTSKIARLKVKADDFARTDADVKKEAERAQKAAEARAGQGGAPLPAMGGAPGTQQIPPDVLKKIQAQMAKQPPP